MTSPAEQQPLPSRPYIPLIDATEAPRPRTVSSTTGASALLLQGVGLIVAITAIESTGSAGARWRVHDGTDTTGEIVAFLAAVANGSCPIAPGLPGIYFRVGLYLEAVSGAMHVSVTYLPLLSPL